MYVGQKVRVMKLDRPAPDDADRSAYVGRDGMLVQRTNVPWTPDIGGVWLVRFSPGDDRFFAENELAVVDARGEATPVDLEELKESWGDAPRQVPMPFKRRFGAGNASAPALLGVMILVLAGLLLVVAGLSQSDLKYGAAGGALLVVALGAAAALVT